MEEMEVGVDYSLSLPGYDAGDTKQSRQVQTNTRE